MNKITLSLLVFVLIMSSCSKPQSIRHIVRAVQDVSQNNEKQNQTKATGTGVGPQLLDFNITEDSSGHTTYIANYLTKDTNNIDIFIKVLSPQQLKFDKKLHREWFVNYYYFSDSNKTNRIAVRKYIFKDSIEHGLEFIGIKVE